MQFSYFQDTLALEVYRYRETKGLKYWYMSNLDDQIKLNLKNLLTFFMTEINSSKT